MRTPHWPVLSLAGLLALKLVLMLAAPPLGDEAYYWMWGQALDWSYHDHPPLNAWLLRLSFELFGWNRFALRAPTLVSFAMSVGLMLWWARRLPRQAGGRAAALLVLLASPLFLIFGSIVFPDHLLIALSMLGVHFFVLYSASAEDGAPRHRLLYGAALAVGLAALSKYSALFVGLGFVGWFLATATGRGALRSPHVWAAGALALAVQAPVAWWNLVHDMETLRFHFHDRIDGSTAPLAVIGRVAVFAVLGLAMASPPLAVAFARLLRASGGWEQRTFRIVGAGALAAALLAFVALGLRTQIHFYWIIPALVPMLPVAVAFFGPRLLKTHAVYGTVIAALLTLHLSVIPLPALVGIRTAEEISFGWAQVAERVEEEAKRHDAQLLLATQYNLAALLGFELGRTDVYSIAERAEQYDIWFDSAAHAGSDAILLADADRPVNSSHDAMFESVEPIGEVEVRAFGLLVHRYFLYLGRGLRSR